MQSTEMKNINHDDIARFFWFRLAFTYMQAREAPFLFKQLPLGVYYLTRKSMI